MTAQRAFQLFFNGKTNFITPQPYLFGSHVVNGTLTHFEISHSRGTPTYWGVTVLVEDSNSTISRPEPGTSKGGFNSLADANAYIKTICHN